MDTILSKATSLIIGSYLLKEIYENADQARIEKWSTPWKQLFEWSSLGYLYDGPLPTFVFAEYANSESEYDSLTEHSLAMFKELPQLWPTPSIQSYDSWESLIRCESQPDPPEMVSDGVDSIASEGIPDLVFVKTLLCQR